MSSTVECIQHSCTAKGGPYRASNPQYVTMSKSKTARVSQPNKLGNQKDAGLDGWLKVHSRLAGSEMCPRG